MENLGDERVTFLIKAVNPFAKPLTRNLIVAQLKQVTDVALLNFLNLDLAEFLAYPSGDTLSTELQLQGLLTVPTKGEVTSTLIEGIDQVNQKGINTPILVVTSAARSFGAASMGVTIPTNGGEKTETVAQAVYVKQYHLDYKPWADPPVAHEPEQPIYIYVLDTVSNHWADILRTAGFISAVHPVGGDRTDFDNNKPTNSSDVNDHGRAVIDVIRRVMLQDPSLKNPDNIKIILIEVMNQWGVGTFNSFIAQLDLLQNIIVENNKKKEGVHLVNMSFVFDLIATRDFWADFETTKDMVANEKNDKDTPVDDLEEGDWDRWKEKLNDIEMDDNRLTSLAEVLRAQIADGVWDDADIRVFSNILWKRLPIHAEFLKETLKKIVTLSETSHTCVFAAAGNFGGPRKVPCLPAALLRVRGVSATDLPEARPPEFVGDKHENGYWAKGKVIAPFGNSFGEWSGTSFATPAILGLVAREVSTGQMTLEEASTHFQQRTVISDKTRHMTSDEQKNLEELNILSKIAIS